MTGKVVVITGGGSGIGRATALAFARQGTKVIIGDIDLAGANDTVASIKNKGGEADCLLVDGAAGYHLYRHGLFPPITMLQDVMREDIAPWDERNKNNNHQHGFDVFCRGVVDFVGGP